VVSSNSELEVMREIEVARHPHNRSPSQKGRKENPPLPAKWEPPSGGLCCRNYFATGLGAMKGTEGNAGT